MDCFVGMLVGLLKTRNINLTEIAIGFASDTQPGSRCRRVQRFQSRRDSRYRPHPHQTLIGRCCGGLLLSAPYRGMAARLRQAHQIEKAPASGEKYF